MLHACNRDYQYDVGLNKKTGVRFSIWSVTSSCDVRNDSKASRAATNVNKVKVRLACAFESRNVISYYPQLPCCPLF